MDITWWILQFIFYGSYSPVDILQLILSNLMRRIALSDVTWWQIYRMIGASWGISMIPIGDISQIMVVWSASSRARWIQFLIYDVHNVDNGLKWSKKNRTSADQTGRNRTGRNRTSGKRTSRRSPNAKLAAAINVANGRGELSKVSNRTRLLIERFSKIFVTIY